MALRETSLLIAALVALTAPAIAQGAGGGVSASSPGTGGTAATMGAASGNGQGTKDAAGAKRSNPSSAPAGSPTAAQAQRNVGDGTAPNGVPIGNPGSGIGSPEQPIDSGSH
jgi:hypothetical protein